MQHSARCMESISVIAIRYGTVARENGTWIRESRSRTYLSAFYMSFEFSSLFLSLFSFFPFASFRSLFFARSRIKVSKRWTFRVRFSEFSIHRVTEPLKTVVYRFVDRETFDHA